MMTMRAVKASNRDYLLKEDNERKRIEDYYGKDAEKEPPHWYGKGAEARGLRGELDSADLEALFKSQESAKRRVYGYDLTFSSDKSISCAMAQDPATRRDMLDAERAAVERTLDYAIRQGWIKAQTTKDGEAVKIQSNQITVAEFHHDTARPTADNISPDLDSHIHTLVLNSVQVDGRELSLDATDLYRHQKELGLEFRRQEAKELHQRGYKTETLDAEQGFFQLEGFSQIQRERYSQRRRQIEEYATENGLDTGSASAMQVANDQTRKNKHDFSLQDKMQEVRQELAADGWHVEKYGNPITPTELEQEQAFAQALEAASRSNYAVSQEELTAAAIKAGVSCEMDEATAARELVKARERGEVVTLHTQDGAEMITTQHNQRTEAEILQFWQDGRGKGFAIDSADAEQELEYALERKNIELADEQKRMIYHVLCTDDDLVIVNGAAGTGKTFSLDFVREVAEAQGYEVLGGAFTGKAADGLQNEAKITSATMDSIMIRAEIEAARARGEEPPSLDCIDFESKRTFNFEGLQRVRDKQKLVILDEAGMVNNDKMHEFLRLAKIKNWKVVLAGDYQQFPAIGAGAPMERLIKAGAATAYLQDIRRQEAEEDRAAVLEFIKDGGSVKNIFDIWETKGYVSEVPDGEDRMEALTAAWERSDKDIKDRLILTNTNNRRKAYNRTIIEHLQHSGQLPKAGTGLKVDIEAPTKRNPEATEQREFLPRQRVIFLRNTGRHDGFSVKNGTLGTIEAIEGQEMRVRTDAGEVLTVNTEQYRALDHAYCVTSMKSQGMSIKDVYADIGSRERGTTHAGLYVAGSRHKSTFHLITDNKGDLLKTTEKAVSKVTSADFVEQYDAGNHVTGTGYKNRIARARSIAQKMRVPQKVLASRLPRQGAARLGNVASFAKSAAGRGKDAAGAVFDFFDEDKKGTDIMQSGAKRVLSVAKAPVHIIADIVRNPLRGILKAPLTAAGAAIDVAQGTAEIAIGAAKTTTQQEMQPPAKVRTRGFGGR